MNSVVVQVVVSAALEFLEFLVDLRIVVMLVYLRKVEQKAGMLVYLQKMEQKAAFLIDLVMLVYLQKVEEKARVLVYL